MMKKSTVLTQIAFTIIIILLHDATKSNAQNQTYQYQPMAVEGATWVFANWHYEIVGRFGYHIAGDTIINDLEYKKGFNLKFVDSDTSNFLSYQYDFTNPTFFIRDDSIDKKVYAINPDIENESDCRMIGDELEEFLLYDFGSEINDTIYSCPDGYTIQLNSIDTVEYFGYSLPRRTIGNSLQYEKIGQSSGLFGDVLNIIAAAYSRYLEFYCVGGILECIEEIGPLSTTEIKDDANLKVFPNPSASEIQITSNTEIESIQVFNMTGQQVLKLIDIQNQKALLDISSLQSQSYFILVRQKDNTVIRKVIIKI